jgi:hypothetical protein
MPYRRLGHGEDGAHMSAVVLLSCRLSGKASSHLGLHLSEFFDGSWPALCARAVRFQPAQLCFACCVEITLIDLNMLGLRA